MTAKIQGEGDYESARHYNEETKRFVDERTKKGEEIKGSGSQASEELTAEEREALSRAKHTDQDKRDAELLRDMEKQPKR